MVTSVFSLSGLQRVAIIFALAGGLTLLTAIACNTTLTGGLDIALAEQLDVGSTQPNPAGDRRRFNATCNHDVIPDAT
jgi:hypothetical protein